MVFVVEGKSYDTAAMRAFDTGRQGMPTIYVSGEECFVLRTAGRLGVKVFRITCEEAREMGEAYGMGELLAVLSDRVSL